MSAENGDQSDSPAEASGRKAFINRIHTLQINADQLEKVLDAKGASANCISCGVSRWFYRMNEDGSLIIHSLKPEPMEDLTNSADAYVRVCTNCGYLQSFSAAIIKYYFVVGQRDADAEE